MGNNTIIHIGIHARVDQTLLNAPRGRNHSLGIGQGAQILRVPAGSSISNLSLQGGASHRSPWAALRGAVLKFATNRTIPIILTGKGFVIPSGHTLMDREGFLFTIDKRNAGRFIPYKVIKGLSRENLYLVHISFCHPDQLFLPVGRYANTQFRPQNLPAITHMELRDGTLFLKEVEIINRGDSFNLLEQLDTEPHTIVVQLSEGGHLTLTDLPKT